QSSESGPDGTSAPTTTTIAISAAPMHRPHHGRERKRSPAGDTLCASVDRSSSTRSKRNHSARLAAWVALAAAVAVVVALAVLLWHGLDALLVALAALIVGVGAAWLVLSRRGAIRILAAVVAVAAMGGAAAGRVLP